MLEKLRNNRPIQLLIGFIIGVFFGFFLQKGQVTKYEAIFGQLLLIDFTVIKVMLTAIIIGMFGIYVMRTMGLVSLNIKPGSWGMNCIGGLIFGAGMAILGYCPGTTAGAAGQGSLDALIGGIGGMIAGGMIYTRIYSKISDGIFKRGDFGQKTLPELLGIRIPTVMLMIFVLTIVIFTGLEITGL
ncbi:MAG: YeeE/YedE thiosulfate transporter family protein [Desulfobacterales bacterium]